MISRVGTNSAATTNVSISGYTIQKGDYMLVFAHRTATTAPSLPAGFTNIANGSGNSNSYRVGYKVCAGTETGSGTWTNATTVIMVVYRGVASIGGSTFATKATNTSATIGAVTMIGTNAKSWGVAWAGHGNTTTQGTPPAIYTNVVKTQAGTSENCGVFDSNTTISAMTATTSSNGATSVSSGGAVELMAYSAISTVSDYFNTGSIDTGLWFVTQNGSATVTSDSSGATTTFPAASTATTDGDISTLVPYDITGGESFVHVKDVPSSSTAADGLFELMQTGGTGNGLRWVYEGGTLYAQSLAAFTPTTAFSVAYNATTHAYWRIRESAGTTFWDTGVDNNDGTVTWTNRASAANPVQVTDLYPVLGGVCYQVETNPGIFKWNNFNVISVPSAIPTYPFFF